MNCRCIWKHFLLMSSLKFCIFLFVICPNSFFFLFSFFKFLYQILPFHQFNLFFSSLGIPRFLSLSNSSICSCQWHFLFSSRLCQFFFIYFFFLWFSHNSSTTAAIDIRIKLEIPTWTSMTKQWELYANNFKFVAKRKMTW